MDKLRRYQKRKRRVRAKVFGKGKRPRLSVYRSNKEIYAQVIDDEKGHTLVSFSSKKLTKKDKEGKKRLEIARLVGEKLAEQALKAKIKKVVFDRGGNKYHGRVKALAEGARKGGLNF
jgi:large subunit ribosomal protein L18